MSVKRAISRISTLALGQLSRYVIEHFGKAIFAYCAISLFVLMASLYLNGVSGYQLASGAIGQRSGVSLCAGQALVVVPSGF